MNKKARGRILAFSARHAGNALGKINGGLEKASAAVDSMNIGPFRALASVCWGLLGDLLTAGSILPLAVCWGSSFLYEMGLCIRPAADRHHGGSHRGRPGRAGWNGDRLLAAYGVSSGAGLTVSLFFTGAVTVGALVCWAVHLVFRNRVI